MFNYNVWVVIICFCGSTILFGKAAGTLDPGKLNLISYIYYLFMLQTFIGIALISIGLDKHYTLTYLMDREDTLKITFLVIMAVSIALPLCILLFEYLFKAPAKKKYQKFLYKKVEVTDSDSYFTLLAIVSVILILLLLGFLTKIGYIPIIKLFTADENFNFGIERSRISNLYFIHPYVTNILILQFIPLFSYLSFTFSVLSKKKKWYILTTILFVASLVTKTYKFSKGPLPFHILVYLIIFMYITGRIKKIVMFLFGGSMVVLFMGAYVMTGFQGSFFDIYNGILGRTFFTQVGTLAYSFELFPKYFGFLEGRSIAPTILRILGKNPEEHLRSAKLVMDYYGSEKVYDGTAGVMNSFFVGEAYANYGYLGVVFSVIWVAFCVALIFAVAMKLKKNAVSVTFFAVMLLKIGNITQGGFFDFIYNIDILLTMVLFVGLYYWPFISKWLKEYLISVIKRRKI